MSGSTDRLNSTAGDSAQVRLVAIMSGRVQGVGFRAYVRRQADRLGLHGYVANRADGSVECVAEGDRAAVDALLAFLRTGPPGSQVDRVAVRREAPAGGLGPFTIRAMSHPGD